MVKIKVCGLTRRVDVQNAVKLGVSALGFILANSPRQVSLEQVAKLCFPLPPFISRVAVVVNPKEKFLEEIVKTRLFDYIQFHGLESPELISSVPLKTIKAISIATKKDLALINKYPDVDYILLDTKTKNKRGGTGKSFNWDLIKDFNINKPLILAGGLGVHNIKEALIKVNPSCVDLNSKVEKEIAKKDQQLLAATIKIINEFNY